MLIIAVQNPKGGATKSTTAVNLARAFQKKMGLVVALGETDPQGTLREWVADNQSFDDDMPKVVPLLSREAILSVRENEALEHVELLIVDGLANGLREFIAVQNVADMIVVVSQPSPADIKPISDIIDVLSGKNVQLAFLLSRTKKGDDLTEIIRKSLSIYQYPVLKSTIRNLKGFATSFGVGRTVFEFSDYKEAQADVTAVAVEIMGQLGIEV